MNKLINQPTISSYPCIVDLPLINLMGTKYWRDIMGGWVDLKPVTWMFEGSVLTT